LTEAYPSNSQSCDPKDWIMKYIPPSSS
jgi:hypothetical protein